jgi:RNA polymerase sigma-70 factor (ECF subfamily)
MNVEAHLLQAARDGDPAAMNTLLTTLRPDIRRYATYQCNRATAIDEIVQETLIIVNRRLGTVNNLAAFAGWLVKVIARLCLLPALRAIQAAESLIRVENSADFSGRRTDDLRIDVGRAVESLPSRYREVILLRDFQELTISEMAARLELSRAATKSRLHRARAMVREYLLTGEDDT